jgi:tetratricopeptide (TPR) repeat protein
MKARKHLFTVFQEMKSTKTIIRSLIKRVFYPSRPSIITGLFIFVFVFPVSVFGQTAGQLNCPPLVTGGAIPTSQDIDVCLILQSLQREAFPLPKRNQILTGVVQKRSIKFILTDDEEQLFRDAGASDALIEAIRKESAKLEKTAFGYNYLGNKYLALGRKYRALEEQFSRAARDSRAQKNETEAIRNEEEARKNNDEAVRNLERAASYFKLASEVEPDNLIAVNNIGVTYVEAKRYDDALVYFSRVIEREPTPSRYINRGTVYERKGQSIPVSNMEERRAAFDRAIADYTSALSIDPTNTTALKNRAEVHKFWGRKQEYEADMKRLDDIRNGRVSP